VHFYNIIAMFQVIASLRELISDLNMFTFNKKYLILTIILFVIEVLIAVFVRDAFVRPYVGDYLVVILIYCAVRTVLNASVWKVALGVLLFSFLIETLQYFHIVNRLGLENNVVARTVIGYGFEWEDILAYTLGIVTVLVFENKNLHQSKK
jgi:hypothetical protein